MPVAPHQMPANLVMPGCLLHLTNSRPTWWPCIAGVARRSCAWPWAWHASFHWSMVAGRGRWARSDKAPQPVHPASASAAAPLTPHGAAARWGCL